MHLRKVGAVVAVIAATLVAAAPATAHRTVSWASFGLGLDDPVSRFAPLAEQENTSRPQSFAPCVNGKAAQFPCDDIDLLSYTPLPDLGGAANAEGNDVWGWTDPKTGRDYALMGRTDGTSFVDVTDPKRPRVVGNLPTQTNDPVYIYWRDIKVYENHAYIVAEHTGHGVQVFDLTRLRDAGQDGLVTTFSADAWYDKLSNIHNIFINEDSGYAYAIGATVGPNTCGGGLHVIDIREPKNPQMAGCYGGDGYTHDVQCITYDGPDARYTGREICFASNEDTVTIVDMTDPANGKMLSRTGYPSARYTHQGWLTPDRETFVFNDELDELYDAVSVQTTYQLDVSDLEQPGTVVASPNNTPSIDHNLYIEGRYIYESNYTSGLRIFDGRDVPTDDLREVAYFDVFPAHDDPDWYGTWSNYRFKKNGVIAVSGIDSGLFMVKPRLGG